MTVSVIHPAPLVEASARCLSIGVKAEIEIGSSGMSTVGEGPGSDREVVGQGGVTVLLDLGSSPALKALILCGCPGVGLCLGCGLQTLRVTMEAGVGFLPSHACFDGCLHLCLRRRRSLTATILAVLRAEECGHSTTVMGRAGVTDARYACSVPGVFLGRFEGRVS